MVAAAILPRKTPESRQMFECDKKSIIILRVVRTLLVCHCPHVRSFFTPLSLPVVDNGGGSEQSATLTENNVVISEGK